MLTICICVEVKTVLKSLFSETKNKSKHETPLTNRKSSPKIKSPEVGGPVSGHSQTPVILGPTCRPPIVDHSLDSRRGTVSSPP